MPQALHSVLHLPAIMPAVMDSDNTPAAPASPNMDQENLRDLYIWKPGDPPGEPEKEFRWKWVRTYDWSFDIKEPNGFPPPNTVLDAYLVWRIFKSELPIEEWSRRWPVNFYPRGHMKHYFRLVGSALEMKIQGMGYYVKYKGVKLLGEEGGKAELPTQANNAIASQSNKRKRTCDLISGYPSSPKRKMMVRDQIPEEEDDTILLKRAVVEFQELLLEADEMMDRLKKSRNVNACLNAWREIASKYNFLSNDTEKLL